MISYKKYNIAISQPNIIIDVKNTHRHKISENFNF